jgi:hypothetical protein
MAYTAVQWIQILVLGSLLGAAGQLIRAIAGLKKLSDDASRQGLRMSDCFAPSQLVISVMIGAVAGLLGAIGLGLDLAQITPGELTPLIGFGYAGSDFIEAFMKARGTLPPLEAGRGTAPVTALAPKPAVAPAEEPVG